eukprot:485513_1
MMDHTFLLIFISFLSTQVLGDPFSYYDVDFSDYYLEDYCMLTTHNAYSAGYAARSQAKGIDSQISDGVRAFMLDTYLKDASIYGGKIVLCHAGECQLKYLYDTLQKIVDHLDDTKDRCTKDPVIIVLLEDYVKNKTKFVESFKRVHGLVKYVFDPFSAEWDSSSNHWPTVEAICASNQRLLLMSDVGETSGHFTVSTSNDVYVMYQKSFNVENTYSIGHSLSDHSEWDVCKSRWDERPLTTFRAGNVTNSNVPNGKNTSWTYFNWPKLFVMNHFHATGEEIHSKYDNSFDQLFKRYRYYCSRLSGYKVTNMLAIDFYNRNRKDAQNFLMLLNQKSGLILFEGNDVTQDALCYIPTTRDFWYNLQKDDLGCDNDEARSIVLTDVKRGTVIVIADNPDGLHNDGGEDDWLIIYVKQDIGGFFPSRKHYELGTLQLDDLIDDYYILAYYFENDSGRGHGNNKLNGKVSNVQIKLLGDEFTVESDTFYEDGLAKMVLHEGNDGSQNTVCTLNIDYVNRDWNNPQTINFKKDSYGCDNDETRSLTITKGLKGTIIKFYDSPDRKTDDDWVEIEIIKSFHLPITINSYQNYNGAHDEYIKVTLHYDNGLDGKVSSCYIYRPPKNSAVGGNDDRRRMISSDTVVPTFIVELIRLLAYEADVFVWTETLLKAPGNDISDEDDRSEIFNATNLRFDTVDESVWSLKTYLKTEIDAQSGLITTNINQKYNLLSNQMTDQSSMITTRFNTLAYGLRKNASLIMKTVRQGNVDILNEMQASSVGVEFQIKESIEDVNETVNYIQSKVNNQEYKLNQIQDAIDNLNYNNNQPPAAKAEMNMMIEGATKYEQGLIVFKIKTTDLCIFGAVFSGLMVIIMVITHIVWIKCCNEHPSAQRFAAVPKYDYSTSDVEAINK